MGDGLRFGGFVGQAENPAACRLLIGQCAKQIEGRRIASMFLALIRRHNALIVFIRPRFAGFSAYFALKPGSV
jgi:hypothetical protein